MSPPEVWGPAVWRLFHTLAEKINEDAYPHLGNQLFVLIKRICKFLPCPECSIDATKFLAKTNIQDLKTKLEFKNMLYIFHNYVNVKKRKKLFNYANINTYKNYKLIPIFNNFIIHYNTKGNMKLIAESFQRQFVIKDFKTWLMNNIRAFIPPPVIHLPVKQEPVVEPEPETIVEPVVEPVVEPQPEIVVEPEPETIVEPEPVLEQQEEVPVLEQDIIFGIKSDQIIDDSTDDIIEEEQPEEAVESNDIILDDEIKAVSNKSKNKKKNKNKK